MSGSRKLHQKLTLMGKLFQIPCSYSGKWKSSPVDNRQTAYWIATHIVDCGRPVLIEGFVTASKRRDVRMQLIR